MSFLKNLFNKINLGWIILIVFIALFIIFLNSEVDGGLGFLTGVFYGWLGASIYATRLKR